MEEGTEVELVLILPPELTSSGEKCWVCCQATVMRVKRVRNSVVAAQIRRMEILPELAV